MIKEGGMYMLVKKKNDYKTLKSLVFGGQQKSSFPLLIVFYALLAGVGFVYVFPILVMLTSSTKDVYDLINPLVEWVPTKIHTDNFVRAWAVLGGHSVFLSTTGYMLLIAFGQTFSSALIGYGFAKFDFPFKRIVFILMIVTFIIPDQVTFMPRYLMFRSYDMLRTIFPLLIPALLGQGIKNAIFILIFYQFFKRTPVALDEAAEVDGAGFIRIFYTINLPSALPGIIVVFIFSFVWHWNETYLADLYFEMAIRTPLLILERFTEYFARMFPVSNIENPMLRMNEGLRMAATLICILPLIILYVLVEPKLIESIDRSGITGE